LISEIRRKIRLSLAQRGLIGTFLYLPIPLLRRLRSLDPRRRRQMAEKLEAQREFDRAYHVDTADKTELHGLGMITNYRDMAYLGIDPQPFRAAIGSLPIRHEDFVFIDFESGKGKALFLAAEWPFKAIIGVERAPALHGIAESNMRTYRNPAQRCRDLRSINVDAIEYEYELPAEPAVLHFYHHLGQPLLCKILERVRRSLEQNPRELWACYYCPYAHRPLDESPLFEVISVMEAYRIYRDRTDRRVETMDTERSGIIGN
jgi:hypothetical protein